MTKRDRIRKIHTDAERIYRELNREGTVIIDRLPRKKIDLNEFTTRCVILSNWN